MQIKNKNGILKQQISENSENIQSKENVILTLTENNTINNDKLNDINHKLKSSFETINLLKKKRSEEQEEIKKLKELLLKGKKNENKLLQKTSNYKNKKK